LRASDLAGLEIGEAVSIRTIDGVRGCGNGGVGPPVAMKLIKFYLSFGNARVSSPNNVGRLLTVQSRRQWVRSRSVWATVSASNEEASL